jgi:hypothetical protein
MISGKFYLKVDLITFDLDDSFTLESDMLARPEGIEG